VAGYRQDIRLRWVLEMSMTAGGSDMLPTLQFDEPDQISNLHLF